MQTLEPEPLPPLLVRRATGPAASAVVGTLAGGARPELVDLAGTSDALVLWLGDVAIHDAVPLAAAVMVIDDSVATLVAVALAACSDRCGVAVRLSREVVKACRATGCQRLVATDLRRDDVETRAFCRLLAEGLAVDRTAGAWALEL